MTNTTHIESCIVRHKDRTVLPVSTYLTPDFGKLWSIPRIDGTNAMHLYIPITIIVALRTYEP